MQVETHLEYHVLRLSIVDEQMQLPPKWLTAPEYVVTQYHRNWLAFSKHRAISKNVPNSVLNSPLPNLTLPELWFLRDMLERGRVVDDTEVANFDGGSAHVLWRSPAYGHGRRLWPW
jgi:hypothetical protein